MRKPLVLLAVIASFGGSTRAQTANERIYHQNPDKIKVFGKTGEQTMAWCGGVNNPQFAMADLNNDGKEDLVIYETYGMPKTFIYIGTPGNPKYKYMPTYVSKFPEVQQYIKLVDYDRDGIPDLFHHGPQTAGGVAACKGYYKDGFLHYDQCRDIRYVSPGTPGTVNIQIDNGAMPAFADIDGDMDIDILVYSDIGVIKLYKNFQEEDKQPKDVLRFFPDGICWGGARQQEYDRTHVLGACRSSPKPEGLSQNKTTGGSHSLCLLDGDGDGDLDILDVNQYRWDVQYLENGRNVYGRDTMISQDTMWQSNKKQMFLYNYPVAYWLDIDHDGDKDILISPFATNTENYRCVYYYRNEGSNSSPAFSFKTDTLFLDDMIDVGERAFPVMFDYDKDGKLDLFVGSGGYFQLNAPPDNRRSKIAYYKNTSTQGQYSVALETSDFMGLSSLNLSYAAPAFGDLDGDGKDDMVLGKKDGKLLYFKNRAASNNDLPVWDPTIGNLMAGSMEVDVVADAAPFIYDFNQDGHKDLIIGGESGKLAYYESGPSTGGKPALRLVTDNLGGVDVSGEQSAYGYSVPFIGKIDNSGKEYLLVGSNKGTVFRYSFQRGNTTTPFTLVETNYSDTKVTIYGGFTAPFVFDVDGDGKYEMIIGTNYGGLMLYEQMFATGISEISHVNKLMLYPNPATDQLIIAVPEGYKADNSSFRIYNNIGQTVNVVARLNASGELSADISRLPAGLYMCRVVVDELQYSCSFMKK